MRGKGVRLACAMLVAILLLVRTGRAQGEITVVEVAPGASELDPDRLRIQIGAELHTQAVTPDAPSAASASGKLRIDLDHRTGTLTVTYQGGGTPVTRQIPLPADGTSARSAAVMLAGNLARDEASELATELRAARPPDVPAAVVPGPEENRAAADAHQAAQLDADRLQATLDVYARHDRRVRTIWGWSMIVAGAVGSGLDVYLERHTLSASSFVSALANPLLFFGIGRLLATTRFEDLAAFDHQGNGAVATEYAWVRAAHSEHQWRRGGGVALLALGGVAVGAASLVLADGALQVDTEARLGYAGGLVAAGGLLGGLGFHFVTTDGLVERALRSYDAGSLAVPAASSLVGPRVSLLPGGATFGFGGSF
jgi:hypothetical protein